MCGTVFNNDLKKTFPSNIHRITEPRYVIFDHDNYLRHMQNIIMGMGNSVIDHSEQ